MTRRLLDACRASLWATSNHASNTDARKSGARRLTRTLGRIRIA